MVTHGHGVVAHVRDELDKGMLTFRVGIIVVDRGIVSLQAVAGIQQQDVLLADSLPQAVHPRFDGHQAGLIRLAFDIGFVEPGSVDVTGRDNVQGALFRGTGRGQAQYN